MKQFVALKASAGSGKTFALTVRYISLLLLKAHPTQILTLTFTNKAASEMSQRIFKTIQTLGEDQSYLNAIMEQSKLSKAEILHRKQDVLDQYINTELSIYTIDKFINKILREFSGYVKINDDFSIVSNDEELLLYKYLQSLNAQSFEDLIDFAFTQEKKLSSIFGLFGQLHEKNEHFDDVKFDVKLFEQCKKEILINAFLIKEHIQNCDTMSNTGLNAVNFNSVEELLLRGKTWLSKESLSAYSMFKKTKPDILQEPFDALKVDIVRFIHLKEQMILEKLFKVYNQYSVFRSRYNINKNSLEFNDITNMVHALLSGYIDKDFLYFRLDSRYNHLLIDEFQDTSILQYKILEPLIEELIGGSNEEFKTFFYVGDTKQSIYRFRGGNPKLFDYVYDHFETQIEMLNLDINYRSSQSVVHFVNSLFDPLSNYEYQLQKAHSRVQGLVSVEIYDEEIQTVFTSLLEQIQKLLNQGANPNDITILTHTNEDILNIYHYLKGVFPTMKINTEMTSKLIFQKNVSAVIYAIKYLYFDEKIYLTHFNALVGNELETNIDQDKLLLQQSLENIVLHLAQRFDLLDENVIKFLEIVGSYGTLIDFIYEIDNEDTPMVNQEKTGLQIMTIFKSKGLEFDTVILLDRLKGANHDKSSLLFEYTNLDLQHIYYKSTDRDKLDAVYDNALRKEKELKYQDQLNILYVALTRAKHNMIILKKSEKSIFDLLDGKLRTCIIGQLELNDSKIVNPSTSNPYVQYHPLDLGYQKHVIAQEEDQDTNIQAQYFGIATHYCLEMMNAFDLDSLHNALNTTKNKYSNMLDAQTFEDIFLRIQRLLCDDKFQGMIKNSHFFKEQALVFNEELKIMDLFIEKKDEIIIVDYKTTLDEQQSHIAQVKQYVSAVKKIKCNKNVIGYIIYLHKSSINIIKI
ncbi:MAG: RecB-like helicase [Campylobacterota bacterium]|nr:RecB-like helicase [Campylobacterota bacterium]